MALSLQPGNCSACGTIILLRKQTERNGPRNRRYGTVQGTDGTERSKEQTVRNGPRNRRNRTVQGTDGTERSKEQTEQNGPEKKLFKKVRTCQALLGSVESITNYEYSVQNFKQNFIFLTFVRNVSQMFIVSKFFL